MDFSVTKNGKPLSKRLYKWDADAKVFSSATDRLVLDFKSCNGVKFKTGFGCTFDTGSDCTFDTGSDCTFDTNYGCTFNTGPDCMFNNTAYCTFDTGSYCKFYTGSNCTFNTESDCTFDTGSDCTFNTGTKCVIVRRDVFEVIQPQPNTIIKLNGANTPGFKDVPKEHVITIDGREIRLSEESFNELKKQLTD